MAKISEKFLTGTRIPFDFSSQKIPEFSVEWFVFQKFNHVFQVNFRTNLVEWKAPEVSVTYIGFK